LQRVGEDLEKVAVGVAASHVLVLDKEKRWCGWPSRRRTSPAWPKHERRCKLFDLDSLGIIKEMTVHSFIGMIAIPGHPEEDDEEGGPGEDAAWPSAKGLEPIRHE
jgi:hypothetical protein